jgi:hypothetical protein
MDYIFPLSIGVLEVFFFSKLADQIFDQNAPICNYKMRDYKQCIDKRSLILDKTTNKKFIFLLVVATVIFFVISKVDTPKYVRNGTGLGSLFMIIYALFMNWPTMNETYRLVTLGISLAILIYGAATDSWSDLIGN